MLSPRVPPRDTSLVSVTGIGEFSPTDSRRGEGSFALAHTAFTQARRGEARCAGRRDAAARRSETDTSGARPVRLDFRVRATPRAPLNDPRTNGFLFAVVLVPPFVGSTRSQIHYGRIFLWPSILSPTVGTSADSVLPTGIAITSALPTVGGWLFFVPLR